MTPAQNTAAYIQGFEDGRRAAKAEIKRELAKQEQGEPVAYDVRCDNCGGDGYDPKDNNYFCSSCEGAGFLEKLFYTHPQPKREWVGLTKAERKAIAVRWRYEDEVIAEIETKLKEKNT